MSAQIKTKDVDRTFRGSRQAKEDLQGRCFARAVGAKESHDFSPLHRQGEIIHGAEMIKAFIEILNIDDRRLVH